MRRFPLCFLVLVFLAIDGPLPVSPGVAADPVSWAVYPVDVTPAESGCRGRCTGGPLIVLVTHYVTIAGLTGQGVGSGEGVVLGLDGTGGFAVHGRIGFEG